jgi:ADP-ribose pyrophosphatase
MSQGGAEVTRSVIRHPGAVLIIPVLDDGRLVMIRNWRVALEQAIWEFPAGTLEPGEQPLVSAGRELSEETGYTAESLTVLGSFYTSPGFADERMHVFVATGLSPGPQRLEPHEEIVVESRSWHELSTMVTDGTLVDGKSIAAMQLWSVHQSAMGEY